MFSLRSLCSTVEKLSLVIKDASMICKPSMRVMPRDGSDKAPVWVWGRRVSWSSLPLTRRFCHGQAKPPKEAPHPLSAHELYERLSNTVTTLEKASTVYGYSLLRIGAVVVMVTGLGVFVFREVIRDNVADEVSTVATKTLADEGLQQKTQEITIELLHTIFRSREIQTEAVRFLENILQYGETQEALKSLVLHVITQPETLSRLGGLLKDVTSQALGDDVFRSQLADSIRLLLSEDNTKQAVLDVLRYVLNDPDVLEATKDFLQRVLASRRIQEEATRLGKSVLDGVVRDPETQKHTGDALWNVFQYSVTPNPSGWFSSGGKGEKTKEREKKTKEVTQEITEKEENRTKGEGKKSAEVEQMNKVDQELGE